MEKYQDSSIWGRLLLIGVLLVVLGLTVYPHDERRDRQLVRQALNSRNYGAAAQALGRLAEREPQRADLRIAAGHYALWSDDVPAAIEHLTSEVVQCCLTAADWLMLGDAYQASGDDALAEQSWRLALSAGCDAWSAYARLLPLHQKQNDYENSLVDLKALVAARPHLSFLYARYGRYLSASDPEAALVFLNQALALGGPEAESIRSLQSILRAAVLEEETAYTLAQAGRWFADRADWFLAEQSFAHAVKLRPDYAEAWAFWGETEQHMPPVDFALAQVHLQQALTLAPDSAAVNGMNGLYWLRQADFDQALPYYEKAAALEPQNPIYLAELGAIYAGKADLSTAQIYYQQAIDQAPDDAYYWQLLANFLVRYQVHLKDTALPAARQAVILAPQDPASLDVMGQVLFLLDDQYSALRFFYRAYRADPNYPPVNLHLGTVYFYMGDTVRAQSYLQRVRDLAPDTPYDAHAQRLLSDYLP